MAKYEHDFEERQPGITRYVVWALAISLAVGGFLYADGYFDEMVEQTTEAPNPPTDAG